MFKQIHRQDNCLLRAGLQGSSKSFIKIYTVERKMLGFLFNICNCTNQAVKLTLS
jgi:hypothetical protein